MSIAHPAAERWISLRKRSIRCRFRGKLLISRASLFEQQYGSSISSHSPVRIGIGIPGTETLIRFRAAPETASDPHAFCCLYHTSLYQAIISFTGGNDGANFRLFAANPKLPDMSGIDVGFD